MFPMLVSLLFGVKNAYEKILNYFVKRLNKFEKRLNQLKNLIFCQ